MKDDEDDPLVQYSSIAAYLLTMYHLIEGIYFAINSTNADGLACRELMIGDFRKAGCFLRSDDLFGDELLQKCSQANSTVEHAR